MEQKLRAVDFLRANNSPEPVQKKLVTVSIKGNNPTQIAFGIKRGYLTVIQEGVYQCTKVIAENLQLLFHDTGKNNRKNKKGTRGYKK